MIFEQLNIQRGIIAIIGSGGKTTLLHTLARELSQHAAVLLATTTHFYPSAEFPWVNDPTEAEVRAALLQARAVQVGCLQASGKLAQCSLPCKLLSQLADYVLVEADGSKQLPLKAHAAHEPVIPENCGKTICVVGASGFGKPICEVVHRPERFCSLVGSAGTAPATPELVAEALEKEALADVYLVNQADDTAHTAQAAVLARRLEKPVFAGSLRSASICRV